MQSSLQHFARRQLRQVLGNVNPAGVELEQLDMFFGLASAQDQPQRRLLAGPGLVLLKPAEILARQGSSACCCILTQRASEGSVGKPRWHIGRYVRFESPLHAGLQAEGPVAGVSG